MYKIHHLTSVITHSWPILFHLCVPPPWIVLKQISDMILSVPIAGKPRNRSSATLTMVTAASAWSSASSVERRVWPKGLFCCPNRNSVTCPGSHTEPVCFCLHLWRETGGSSLPHGSIRKSELGDCAYRARSTTPQCSPAASDFISWMP